MQSVNDAQWLNITYFFLSSACLTAAPAPAPVINMVLLKSIYASQYSHKLKFNLQF